MNLYNFLSFAVGSLPFQEINNQIPQQKIMKDPYDSWICSVSWSLMWKLTKDQETEQRGGKKKHFSNSDACSMNPCQIKFLNMMKTIDCFNVLLLWPSKRDTLFVILNDMRQCYIFRFHFIFYTITKSDKLLNFWCWVTTHRTNTRAICYQYKVYNGDMRTIVLL